MYCFKLPYFGLIKRLFLQIYFGSGYESESGSGSRSETFITVSDPQDWSGVKSFPNNRLPFPIQLFI
jgi:hypothetical protein